MQEIWIDIPSGKVYGKTAGEGPLVLGLHGWSQRNGWHTWKPLMEPLAQAGYRVVSVDMPGWGQSPALAAGKVSGDEAVRVVLALLDGLEAEKATLMGKSWGGGVALQVALDHPQRVERLILTAPAFRDFSRLGQLQAPVLLAWAEDDPVIPIENAQKYIQNVPEIEVVTYESGGHSAAPKNVEEFAPKAIQFLQS